MPHQRHVRMCLAPAPAPPLSYGPPTPSASSRWPRGGRHASGCARRLGSCHLRALRQEQGLELRFSVGFSMTDKVQEAILALPECAWTPAVDADGSVREGADVAEVTGLLPDLVCAGWPSGMRVIVRRERPHPGAQLRFTDLDGWRFQALATDTPVGQLAHLEARHRAHRPSRGPHPGRQGHRPGSVPVPALRDQRRLVGTRPHRLRPHRLDQTTLLHGELAICEPKALRYRLLHVAARLTRGQRRLWLRIADHWP
jgi:hypothetical protein